ASGRDRRRPRRGARGADRAPADRPAAGTSAGTRWPRRGTPWDPRSRTASCAPRRARCPPRRRRRASRAGGRERARRDSLREEPLEVGLVLRVLGGALEPLRLPVRSPRRAAAVALLVDLAPAPGAFRLLVVGHQRKSNPAHRQSRAPLHRLWTTRRIAVPHGTHAPPA